MPTTPESYRKAGLPVPKARPPSLLQRLKDNKDMIEALNDRVKKKKKKKK